MRIKNRRGERNQAIGKRSVPSSISLPNSDHKSSPASPKRLQPELAGAERRVPRVRSAEAAGEGNGRVGWAWLARGRARNKAAPAPPTWSWGVAQARGAGRAERRSFGTMAPLPSLPRPPAVGRPGTKARNGAGRPSAQVGRRRERGRRRRPSRAGAGPLGGSTGSRPVASRPGGAGALAAQRGAGPRAARRRPRVPAADGARRAPRAPLTHSPTARCPSSWRNRRRLGAGRLGSRCSARPDFSLRGLGPPSPRLESCRQPPGSPVSEGETRLERAAAAAAASPPPGSREGGGRGRGEAGRRGGGGPRCTLGSGRARARRAAGLAGVFPEAARPGRPRTLPPRRRPIPPLSREPHSRPRLQDREERRAPAAPALLREPPSNEATPLTSAFPAER